MGWQAFESYGYELREAIALAKAIPTREKEYNLEGSMKYNVSFLTRRQVVLENKVTFDFVESTVIVGGF